MLLTAWFFTTPAEQYLRTRTSPARYVQRVDPLCISDFEPLAREQLASDAYEYYVGGSCDEATLNNNVTAWGEIDLKPHVLRDVSRRTSNCTVLGQQLAVPFAIAPTAFHKLATSEGELATARAAQAAGTAMTLSTLSNTPIEEVAAATTGPLWFQLYVYRDRGSTRELVRRAESAGAKALFVTVDAPVQGWRERDRRSGFHLPPGLGLPNVMAADAQDLPAFDGDSGLAHYINTQFDPSLAARDIEWLRTLTELPIAVKGVLRGDDAVRAVAAGASAIVVSNHGGRQLDTAVATARALPEIIDAVGTSAEVIVDGGIRRGTDIVKALAYGARAVLLGRPILWGLAADGERGATRALELFAEEFDAAMALCGAASPDQLTRELIA